MPEKLSGYIPRTMEEYLKELGEKKKTTHDYGITVDRTARILEVESNKTVGEKPLFHLMNDLYYVFLKTIK